MQPANPSSNVRAQAESGRARAKERRALLAQGKAALPAPTERVRDGQRSARLPGTGGAAAHAPSEASPVATPAASPASLSAGPLAPSIAASSGRQAARQRRLQLSQGKAGLSALASLRAAPASPAGGSTAAPAVLPPEAPGADRSGRFLARARRAMQSVTGRGAQPAAPASRPPRLGRLEYAPKVLASPTQGGQKVTGLRIGAGSQVTGHSPGLAKPVSGTQYIGTDGGGAYRPSAPKVGLARTIQGQIVSGTLIRSKVHVTGDEAGAERFITGEADGRPTDDLTPRPERGTATSAQFNRQTDPHGHSVFGTNLGRSLAVAGSRQRTRAPALESTEQGLAITGSAVGRSVRVTGDARGACTTLTGDQYLTPARSQAECGGQGGGTAPGAHLGLARIDPASGGKVRQTHTWSGQRVSGVDLEHHPRVTGTMPGTCAPVTGSPYQGPRTVVGWCDEPAVDAVEARQNSLRPGSRITGDVPLPEQRVSGLARGAARVVSGTPYYTVPEEGDSAPAPGSGPSGFSIPELHKGAVRNAQRVDAAGRQAITGSFALGADKLTGNQEFAFRARQSTDPKAVPAHARVTGEGLSHGTAVTGGAWSETSRVTGTEGRFAAVRSPSERGAPVKPFAGARRFKEFARHEEQRQLVTGNFGWSSQTAARVTLSGGVQG